MHPRIEKLIAEHPGPEVTRTFPGQAVGKGGVPFKLSRWVRWFLERVREDLAADDRWVENLSFSVMVEWLAVYWLTQGEQPMGSWKPLTPPQGRPKHLEETYGPLVMWARETTNLRPSDIDKAGRRIRLVNRERKARLMQETIDRLVQERNEFRSEVAILKRRLALESGER